MKTIINLKEGSQLLRSLNRTGFKGLLFSVLILTGVQATLQAQAPRYTKPNLWIGAAAGANFNFYRGTTQELNSDLTVPAAFHHGYGVGLYLAPLIEYQFAESKWGLMLQTGYDGRNGSFKSIVTPCNCTANLSTNLHYLTIEPSLRFAPFKSNFYVFGGPRLAFNIANSFTYSQKTNPAFAEQVANPDVKSNFSNQNKTLISMQIGAGYDILLSPKSNHTQVVLSPFVAFQPYFGQDPRSIETWTVTTFRVGAALKFGRGHKIDELAKSDGVGVISDPSVGFSVNSPTNIPVDRRVRETFPLRNYVFFNLGSTEIPDRYVTLRKDQVKDFKEDQLEVFSPKMLSGRSGREMIVYYNILNILGDRMGKNPLATITLVGSSEKGPEDGRAMAESIKRYLVDVFGVKDPRINIEGRNKPKIPSEQPSAPLDLVLVREGDRRVSIESNTSALLMEFQSGPDAPMKPVEIIAVQQAPLDSYVSFKADGGNEAFWSWSLEIKDEAGKVNYFGPYTQDKVSIPGKSILGSQPQGDYKVTMIGQTKSGKTVRKETAVHMVLWTPPANEEGMRFSIIFEFDQSKAISIYKKYLINIVTPKIPQQGTVIIHGYTDIIGNEAHNLDLSLARAKEVRRIIGDALLKAGRTDVTFEVHGFGEDEKLSPFENNFPEERCYNRTVIIDIIPKK